MDQANSSKAFILFSSSSIWFKSHLGKVIGADPVKSQDLASACQHQIKTGGVNPRLMALWLPGCLNTIALFPYSFLTYEVIRLRVGPRLIHGNSRHSLFDLFILMDPRGEEGTGKLQQEQEWCYWCYNIDVFSVVKCRCKLRCHFTNGIRDSVKTSRPASFGGWKGIHT